MLLVCSCMPSALSISALSRLVRVVLNSWSDDPSVPATPGFTVPSLPIVILPFGVLCHIFLLAGPDAPGQRSCCERGFGYVEGRLREGRWPGLTVSVSRASGLGASQVFPTLGGTGWLSWAGVGCLPSTKSVRL